MERKLFHKAKLATAIALVSTTTLLTGCLVDGDKSNTNSTTIQEDASRISITDQATPLAQILGLVQDTNGNPVVGARVSIGSAAATTDANGAYAISNVPVTGFTGNASAASASAIQVSIQPTAGFLSATVSVTPQASTIVQTIDGASGNTEDALLAIVTTDGLAVSAGITVVPALQSTVKGVLRNTETGQPIGGAILGLEVTGVNGVNQQQQQNSGTGTGYGVGIYQIATDEFGVFELTNLPVDTDFNIAVEGWVVNTLSAGNPGVVAGTGLFATTPEVTSQNIGTLSVTKIVSSDILEPFVSTVNGVIINAAIGKLNDDLTGAEGLVINFSEPLQDILDGNSVYVFNVTQNTQVNIASSVLAADGKSLTVTTATAVTAGDQFDIYLNIADFQDTAGNTLIIAPNATFQGKPTPAYDTTAGLTSVGTVKLSLQTYTDPVTSAGPVLNLAQLTTDGGVTAFSTLFAFNATFSDLDTGSLNTTDTSVEQLNASEAASRLTTLATSIYTDSGIPSGLEPAPTAVSTSVARIQFELTAATPASNYLVSLTDASGVVKNLNTAEVVAPDSVTATANSGDSVRITIEDGFEGTIDLLLKGVSVNDQVVISSLTDYLTVDGVTAPITLTDSVAPTTVIQSNYGSNVDDTSIVQVNYYGNGGELTSDEQAVIGSPLLNITPRMLVPQANENIALPIGNIWNVLVEDTVLEVANPLDLYDATGYAAWTVAERSRSIGIALSEDVSLNSTLVNYSGTEALSGFTAQNNVFVNDQNTGIGEADLIKVVVPDIIALSQNDHNAVIDLTGAITDISGNTAIEANKAKVVLQDRMPAMLESAVYSGDEIELTFNEAVTFEEGDTIKLGTATTLTLTAAPSGDVTMSAGNTVMTIDRAAWGGEFNLAAVFAQDSYDHDGDAGSPLPTAERGLTYVDFNNLEDALGNTWAADNAGVNIPYIIMPDSVGEIAAATTATLALRAAGIAQTITYSFTHAIDVDVWLGAAQDPGAIVLTEGDINTYLTLSSPDVGTQAIDITALTDANDPTTGSSIVISADRKVITLTLVAIEAIPVDDTIETHTLDFTGNIPSLWSTGTVNVDSIDTLDSTL